MNTHRHAPRALGAAMAVVALLATGCSTKSADTASSVGKDGVKTGPGVTDSTIKLGALSDLTAVFAPLGKNIVAGNQLYFDKVNAAGGVCGRKVELVVRDHAYDVQKAVSAFTETEPDVLGYVQLLGSPMTAALGPEIKKSGTLAVPASWASSLLPNPSLMIVGSTYAVDMVNGLDWLAKNRGIKKGQTVGHIYFEGEYGADALKGSQWAAKELGLKVETTKIKSTDVDLTAQVSALKAKGVKAILLSVGPKQTASVAGVAKSVGLDVPLLANNPGFDPALLKTPVASVLEKNLVLASPFAPFNADTPGSKEAAAAFRKGHPGDGATSSVGYGYAAAETFTAVLQKACADKDLSRKGLQTALRSLAAVDTQGLLPALDFSKPGAPASTRTYISHPKTGAEGGLAALETQYQSPLVGRYLAS